MNEHVEGMCWCEDSGSGREAALDRLFPDRCRDENGPGVPSTGNRFCTLPAGHTEPHYGHLERRGGPCHFCGRSYDGDNCPACWQSIDGLPLADLKAIFADIDLSLTIPDPPDGSP